MRRSYFFVRHGHTEKQVRIISLPPDEERPLTALGRTQAASAARALAARGAERVISSALLRARQTATLIAEGARLPYSDAWPELDEITPARARKELRRRARGAASRWSPLRSRPGEVEAPDIEETVRQVLRRLDALKETRTAVVGHGWWIFAMAVLLRGPLRMRWVNNCSITRVDADGQGHYRLCTFGQRVAARTPGAAAT